MAENYRDKFIKANLTKLIKCTNVDQLVDHLYEKDLIDDSEMNIWVKYIYRNKIETLSVITNVIYLV